MGLHRQACHPESPLLLGQGEGEGDLLAGWLPLTPTLS